MNRREGAITAVILVVVIAVAVWSRVRFADREGYEQPLRVKTGDHPAFQQRSRN